MALFRGRSGQGGIGRWVSGWLSGGTPVRLDPALGDPDLTRLREQAAAGDWESVRDGLLAIEDEADRVWMIAVLAEVAGVEQWTAKAIAAEPDSALPLLLSGARHVSWGWEARTGARAQYVTEEQWKLFHQRLATAEEQLYQAAEREPGWLGPWYFLQISGRGVSMEREGARYRFEAALRRSPGHPASHRQRLQQVCKKWGGSHDEMHAFAREAMLGAPVGSPLGELVALAHIEQWLDDGCDIDYLRRPAVSAQLYEAAQRSVLHPDYVRPRNWAVAHNTFAMALTLAGEYVPARRLFAELDGLVTEAPWHFLDNDHARAFREARDVCAK